MPTAAACRVFSAAFTAAYQVWPSIDAMRQLLNLIRGITTSIRKTQKKRNKFSWSLQTRSWCRLRRRHRVAARLRVDAVWLQLQAEGWIENARQRRLRRKTLTYLNCVAITSIPTILTGSGCINGHMVTPSVGGCYCNVALQREMKHPREFSVSIMLKHLFYCIEFRAGNTSTKV